MRAHRKALLSLFGLTTLTAIVLLFGLPTYAQLKKGCSGIDYLGADSGNPFTAESVTTATAPATVGAPKTTAFRENIARPGVKTQTNTTIEQLRTHEIQGNPARGVKNTTLGTEKDGDWNGKPISESELWVSDDLAAQMLSIRKDLKTGSEGRSELMAIKRGEPDPALFEIPKGFAVNPARMPIARGFGVVRPQRP